jgi:hypothetical protein
LKRRLKLQRILSDLDCRVLAVDDPARVCELMDVGGSGARQIVGQLLAGERAGDMP